MIRFVLLFVLVALSFAARLETGDPLPPIHGERLSDKSPLLLPGEAEGRPFLLLMTFSRAGSSDLEKWALRVRKDYPAEALTYYSVLHMESVPRLMRGMVRGFVRGGIPERAHANTALLYKGQDEWKNRLGVKDSGAAYLVAVSQRGEILWAHPGPFTEESYQSLRPAIDSLKGASTGSSSRIPR